MFFNCGGGAKPRQTHLVTVQYSTMSPVLPFDIINLVIDTVGENKDTVLLKKLALVSHSFHQICSKHLFATIELHNADPDYPTGVASSKKGFVKLLKRRPDVVKYIRKLTYKMEYMDVYFDSDDFLLSPVLPNFLRTIPLLNYIEINASTSDWNKLNSSLTSALLHLMHLPTINHIDLSCITNFPLFGLTSSVVNLHRIDMRYLTHSEQLGEDCSFEIIPGQSEVTPKIREFNTSYSSVLTTKLLHAKKKDGRPAINFTDLRRLSISFNWSQDEQNIRFLLQNSKLLEKLHLSISPASGWSLVRLHDILSPTARTLKILHLTSPLYLDGSVPLGGLCEELEAMAGQNVVETLFFEVVILGLETSDYIGPIIQRVEDVLVRPGWSALRQVQVSLDVCCQLGTSQDLYEALPDKYLSRLSNHESIAFNYSVTRNSDF